MRVIFFNIFQKQIQIRNNQFFDLSVGLSLLFWWKRRWSFFTDPLNILRTHFSNNLLIWKNRTCMSSSRITAHIWTEGWMATKGKLFKIGNNGSIEFFMRVCSNVFFSCTEPLFARKCLVSSRICWDLLVNSEIMSRFKRHVWIEEYFFDPRFNDKRSSVSGRSMTFKVNREWKRSCLPLCFVTIMPSLFYCLMFSKQIQLLCETPLRFDAWLFSQIGFYALHQETKNYLLC